MALEDIINGLVDNQKVIYEDMRRIIESVRELIKLVDKEMERNRNLSDLVYEICPDLEIIESIAETEEERAEMIRAYMNVKDQGYLL